MTEYAACSGGCGQPIRLRVDSASQPMCHKCRRERKAGCPVCSVCSGAMPHSWFYSWLEGKAKLPPVCRTCRPEQLAEGARRRGNCRGCGKRVKLGTGQPDRHNPLCHDCRAEVRPRSLTCKGCGGEFFAKYAGDKQKYCTKECFLGNAPEVQPGHGAAPTRICGYPACGKEFAGGNGTKGKGGSRRGVFCSPGCYHDAQRAGLITGSYPPVQRELPQHQVFVPLRLCGWCNLIMTGVGRRRTHPGDCDRRLQSRLSSQSIMKRYYADPEFRGEVIRKGLNRRARRLGLPGITAPRDLIGYLMERDGEICNALVCVMPSREITDFDGPAGPSADHIVPMVWGERPPRWWSCPIWLRPDVNLHTLGNLQLVHYRCNLHKHDRWIG